MPPPVPRPGRLVRVGVVARTGTSVDPARLVAMAAAAGVDVVWCEREADAAALAGVRPPPEVLVLPDADEAWARTLPVSIGRTAAEADARRALDPGFGGWGDPAECGLFGTLEQCQAQVAALAAGGVVELRCVLPDAHDVHDVMAQLTAVAVGDPQTHRPDRPRSPDPPPPAWARRAP